MRATAPPLLPIFRSQLQGELLALVLVDSARQWTIDELADRTGEPYQTVATEIRRLQKAELLIATTIGRTKLLSANEANAYLRPLSQLAIMAFGPPLVISEEFSSVDRVEAVYIYGSWAARYEGEPGAAPNDIDVLVVGRSDRDDIYDAAQRAQQRLGREVNVTQRTRKQWETATDGFTQNVRSSPMVEVPYPADYAEVEQGSEVIERLLDARQLDHVPADADIVAALIESANRHVASAVTTAADDPEGAFALGYDAARKSATALLAHQGLRPTSNGGHIVIVEAMNAQFPGVSGLKSIDRLRRRRNQAEYPDPHNYDPVTTNEVEDAIGAARDCLAAAQKLIGAPQLGIF